jgi:hypothetical protein
MHNVISVDEWRLSRCLYWNKQISQPVLILANWTHHGLDITWSEAIDAWKVAKTGKCLESAIVCE